MKFSYVVGHYYSGSYEGCIGAYCYHTQVQHGDEEDAKAFLEYVKRNDPLKDWKIFTLKEL